MAEPKTEGRTPRNPTTTEQLRLAPPRVATPREKAATVPPPVTVKIPAHWVGWAKHNALALFLLTYLGIGTGGLLGGYLSAPEDIKAIRAEILALRLEIDKLTRALQQSATRPIRPEESKTP